MRTSLSQIRLHQQSTVRSLISRPIKPSTSKLSSKLKILISGASTHFLSDNFAARALLADRATFTLLLGCSSYKMPFADNVPGQKTITSLLAFLELSLPSIKRPFKTLKTKKTRINLKELILVFVPQISVIPTFKCAH